MASTGITPNFPSPNPTRAVTANSSKQSGPSTSALSKPVTHCPLTCLKHSATPSPALRSRKRFSAPRAIASSSLPAYRNGRNGQPGEALFESDSEDNVPAGVSNVPHVEDSDESLGCPFAHEFTMSSDSTELMEQLMLVRTIQRSTGLCRSASGTPPGTPLACAEPLSAQEEQACFQLVPRKLRGSATSLSNESFALVAGAQVLKSGCHVVEADWPLELAKLSFINDDVACATADVAPGAEEADKARISISSAPAGADDLDWLLDASGATALLLLEPEESMRLLAVNGEEIAARATARGVPVFRIGMGEHDDQKQAAVLPEAVRVVCSLLLMGHRVHITCLRGLTCSPLVVLGYLTFYKGKAFSEAMEAIKSCCPGVSPSYAAWEQAKDHMLAGCNMQRMTDLAQLAYQDRIANERPGSAADDWKRAQRQLLMETLAQRVTGDVTMSQSLAHAELLHAEEAAAEKVKEVEARAAERTRLLARQVEELERSRTEAAGAAASAAEQIQFFRLQVEDLTEKEAEAREAVQAASERVALLTSQLEEMTSRERDARAGAAFTRERTEALEEELDRLREVNDSLAEALAQGREDVAIAESRAQQLAEQLERVQAMEGAARDMAEAMQHKAEVLAATVKELEKRANEAQEQAQNLDTQLAAALKKDEESQRVVAVLQDRVGKLGKEASVAQDSLRAANTRVQFFFRVMNRLLDREKEAQKLAGEASARLAKAASEVEGMREKDVLLTRAWQLAREKTNLLCLQMDSLELLRAEALVVADKDGLLTSSHPQAQAAREALEDSRKKEEELNAQVQELQRQLEKMASQQNGEGEVGEALSESEEAAAEAAMAARAVLEQQREVEERVRVTTSRHEEERSVIIAELKGTKQELEVQTNEVVALKEQLAAAREAAAEAEDLKRQLAEAQDESRRAREAEAAARDRCEFLLRELDRLKERMEETEVAMRQEQADRESCLQDQISGLQEREAEAKAAAAKAEERAEELEEQMRVMEEREGKALAALAAAQEKIGFFFRQQEAHKQRQSRSKAALADSRKQVSILGRQVSGLRARLALSQQEAQKSVEIMEELKNMSLEIKNRLAGAERPMNEQLVNSRGNVE